MQANPTITSRIGLQIGAPVEEGNEKCSVKVDVNIGKEAANTQLMESKALLGGVDVGLCALITLVAAPGKQQELAAVIEGLTDGKPDIKPAQELKQALLAGFVAVKVYQADGNRVVIQVKPGVMTEDMITQQVTGAIQGFGIEAATTSEKTTVSIHAASGVDFHDALEGHKTELPTVATFGKSLKAEAVATGPANSLLEQKVWEILEQFQPGTPAPLLKLVKALDIDLTFRGIDELPADLQRKLKIAKAMFKFPQTPKSQEGTPELAFFKQLVELLEPKVEITAALENVAALKLTTHTPGWGAAFTTTHD
mmetsp:Transcript_17861/g.20382  ORF Transcript_17861/g.20382 Transcript_17861/m.20382 type:complete len:310 (+) Transcript_17861:18-947(+)